MIFIIGLEVYAISHREGSEHTDPRIWIPSDGLEVQAGRLAAGSRLSDGRPNQAWRLPLQLPDERTKHATIASAYPRSTVKKSVLCIGYASVLASYAPLRRTFLYCLSNGRRPILTWVSSSISAAILRRHGTRWVHNYVLARRASPSSWHRSHWGALRSRFAVSADVDS
jgi:hypothetical protein